jgi:predicted DNA-binding protein YlxM (UPF0122 family)
MGVICQSFYTNCYHFIYNLFMLEFWEWITKKYVDYRGDAIGQDRSITEFANWVGVSQQTMSGWMKKGGKLPRSQKSITNLVKKFGPEVYDVLGLPMPEASFPIDSLPSEMQTDLRLALSEIKSKLGSLDPDSPEGDALVRSILKKHGFIIDKSSTISV